MPARRRRGAGGRQPPQRRAALPGVVDTRDGIVQLMASSSPPVPDGAGGSDPTVSPAAAAGQGLFRSQNATATADSTAATRRFQVPSVSKPIWSSADHMNPTTA